MSYGKSYSGTLLTDQLIELAPNPADGRSYNGALLTAPIQPKELSAARKRAMTQVLMIRQNLVRDLRMQRVLM